MDIVYQVFARIIRIAVKHDLNGCRVGITAAIVREHKAAQYLFCRGLPGPCRLIVGHIGIVFPGASLECHVRLFILEYSSIVCLQRGCRTDLAFLTGHIRGSNMQLDVRSRYAHAVILKSSALRQPKGRRNQEGIPVHKHHIISLIGKGGDHFLTVNGLRVRCDGVIHALHLFDSARNIGQ